MTNDPFDLSRFVDAQAACYPQVLDELRRGEKQTHWMWFVFPQALGLGRSPTAEFYAIRSREEAAAYLAHQVLGPRLLECTELVLAHVGTPARRIFGTPDDLKFRSSMTLFAAIAAPDTAFSSALDAFYAGERDSKTLAALARWRHAGS